MDGKLGFLHKLASHHLHTTSNVEFDHLANGGAPHSVLEDGQAQIKTRSHIRVRIVTWNMHDSLPTGDLSDLLGVIPDSPPVPVKEEGKPVLLPLEASSDSLYHIIAVGGQECPSGAWNARTENWTEMLEDYLVYGKGKQRNRTSHPCYEAVNGIEEGHHMVPNGVMPQPSLESLPSTGEGSAREVKGPYRFVIKERLMGIYCAIFVLESCAHLVKGYDKGKVTAGLMGGRVGNKGGVGISLDFAGTRLLFISAHLAAHQDGVAVRKMNISKIKETLDLDDFQKFKLQKSGDITERFDYAFWFGDLNFRLVISRTHADWLLKAKDYATALEFDQLRSLMKQKDPCLAGFAEPPIDFAPTYKYDVLPLRRAKTNKRKLSKRSAPGTPIEGAQTPMDSAQNSDTEVNVGPLRSSSRASTSSNASAMDVTTGESPTLHTSSPQSYDLPSPVQIAKVKFLNVVRSMSTTSLPAATEEGMTAMDRSASMDQTRPILRGTVSALDTTTSTVEHAILKAEYAVFDSSRKQRVQSWTDRILYRCNVAVEHDDPHVSSLHRRIIGGIRNARRSFHAGRPVPNLRPTPSSESGLDRFATTPVIPLRRSSTGHSSVSSVGAPASGWHWPKIIGRSARQRDRDLSPDGAAPVRLRRTTTEPERRKSSPQWPDSSSPPIPPKPRTRLSVRQAPNANLRVLVPPHFSNGLTVIAGSPNSTLSSYPTSSPSLDRSTVDASIEFEVDTEEKPYDPPNTPARPRATSESHGGDIRFAPEVALSVDAPPRARPKKGRSASGEHQSAFSFRSWWHSIVSTSANPTPTAAAAAAEPPDQQPTWIGPKKGEVECLSYHSVNDLRKMEASTDHRPVVGIFAIGLGGNRTDS